MGGNGHTKIQKSIVGLAAQEPAKWRHRLSYDDRSTPNTNPSLLLIVSHPRAAAAAAAAADRTEKIKRRMHYYIKKKKEKENRKKKGSGSGQYENPPSTFRFETKRKRRVAFSHHKYILT